MIWLLAPQSPPNDPRHERLEGPPEPLSTGQLKWTSPSKAVQMAAGQCETLSNAAPQLTDAAEPHREAIEGYWLTQPGQSPGRGGGPIPTAPEAAAGLSLQGCS